MRFKPFLGYMLSSCIKVIVFPTIIVYDVDQSIPVTVRSVATGNLIGVGLERQSMVEGEVTGG